MRRHAAVIASVLRDPKYTAFGAVAAGVAYTFLAVFLNIDLIGSALLSGDVELAASLSWAMATGYHVSTKTSIVVLTVLIAAGIGMNVMLAAYRIVELSAVGASEAGSLLGIGVGTLAPACGSCATSLLAVVGGASLFSMLPLGGIEIHLLSLALLGGSAYWVTSQLHKKHCEI